MKTSDAFTYLIKFILNKNTYIIMAMKVHKGGKISFASNRLTLKKSEVKVKYDR